MDKLILKKIIVNGNRVEYIYEKDGKWKDFLNDNNFFCEYDMIIENVPKSILVIPFLCNILPISFVYDLEIQVEEIDSEFFKAIEKIKSGYQKMYPLITMKGSISSEKMINNYFEASKSGTLFSGGVDAFNTLFQHIEEKPTLLTVWGADIKLSDFDGWNKVKEYHINTANELNLDYSFIKSNLKEFLNYKELSKFVSNAVGDGWWHGFQHGIGLVGLVAPISYTNDFAKVYIASSFTADYWGKYTCASDPVIDNNLKYAQCITVHDGYEFDRQNKIQNICNYKIKSNIKSIPIRVCWESKGGDNCCECEKCTRTILGIIAEKENPNEYGFDFTELKKDKIKKNIVKYARYSSSRYQCIQNRLKENFSIEDTPEYLREFRKMKIKSQKPFLRRLCGKCKRKIKKLVSNIIK